MAAARLATSDLHVPFFVITTAQVPEERVEEETVDQGRSRRVL